MQASLYHIKINVADVDFYRDLLQFIGFKITKDFGVGFGATDGAVSIWVFKNTDAKAGEFNYLNTGLNHIAFRVSSKKDVDSFYSGYLLKNNIKILFEPSEHASYNEGKGYYAVFFSDPDGIKLEVAWVAE